MTLPSWSYVYSRPLTSATSRASRSVSSLASATILAARSSWGVFVATAFLADGAASVLLGGALAVTTTAAAPSSLPPSRDFGRAEERGERCERDPTVEPGALASTSGAGGGARFFTGTAPLDQASIMAGRGSASALQLVAVASCGSPRSHSV
eukprot:scaffold34673_cov60-Phaeocystis_antarctica.AAC.2